MSSFCEMSALLNDSYVTLQLPPSPPQQQQQFALQTLPQHLHAAAAATTAGYVLESDSSDSSDSDSERESNQLDVDSALSSSMMRRKATLAESGRDTHQHAVSSTRGAHLHHQQQPSRDDDDNDDGGEESSDNNNNNDDGGDDGDDGAVRRALSLSQLRPHRLAPLAQQQPPLAALTRKRNARSPDASPDRQQMRLSAGAPTATCLRRESPLASRLYRLPASGDTASAASGGAAAVQDAIRAQIEQTEQLLASVQAQSLALPERLRGRNLQSQSLQSSSLQPSPPPSSLQPSPPPSSAALVPASPLRSSSHLWGSYTESGGDTSELRASRAALPLLSMAPLRDATEDDDGDDNGNDEISGAPAERQDDLSDGEMYPRSAPSAAAAVHPSTRVSRLGHRDTLDGDLDIEQQQQGIQGNIQDGVQGPRWLARASDAYEPLTAGDATNRAINASKARALRDSMLESLLRLGFAERVTRHALDAAVQEIDHFDGECELAYVDIFLSLVKMVCDAHIDSFSPSTVSPSTTASPSLYQHELPSWQIPAESTTSTFDASSSSLPPPPPGAFKWPVFDMAQFEFGNARAGTCFASVCVLTNLPKVALVRTSELLEALSCHLFCMLGDPIQVVIPSASATGRTKGHAFVEFSDRRVAQRCAAAIDGLTWGRGPFGRIRSSMFRQYQVKSPPPSLRLDALRHSGSMSACPSPQHAGFLQFGDDDDDDGDDSDDGDDDGDDSDDARVDGHSAAAARDHVQSPFVESTWSGDGASDAPFSPIDGTAFPVSVYTSSEGESGASDDGVESNDRDDDDEMLWRVNALASRGHILSESARPIAVDDGNDGDGYGFDGFDDPHALPSGLQLPRGHRSVFAGGHDAHFSSDDDEGNDGGFGFGFGGFGDDDDDSNSWGCDSVLELQALDQRSARLHASMSEHEHTEPCAAKPGIHSEPAASSPLGAECVRPWRSYCEELIARNREAQEQVAHARRRIVQLGHTNQKLHALLDRVERERDGLAFENDLLQTQLSGFEDREQHQEALLVEVALLRKRLRRRERDSSASLYAAQCSEDNIVGADAKNGGAAGRALASLDAVRLALQHQLGVSALGAKDVDELRSWEQLLESALGRTRTAREERALARQKQLDRQVEEQQELKLCVICLASEKSILCLPCRHLCLCQTCAARDEVDRCPICRLHIDETLLVYA